MRYHQFCRVLVWLLCLYAFSVLPAWAIDDLETPSSIAYVDKQGKQRIFVFLIDQGKLVHKEMTQIPSFTSGAQLQVWTWVDHGLPLNAVRVRHPKAITYVDEKGVQRIYAFAIMRHPAGHESLVVRYWDGVQWRWQFQQGPELVNADDSYARLWADGLSVVTFPGQSGKQQIYVFGVGRANGIYRVVVNYWNGSSWQWDHLGSPPYENQDTHHLFSAQHHAITYEVNGTRRIDLFFLFSKGSGLYCLTWAGTSWDWHLITEHNHLYEDRLSAVTYLDSSNVQRLYAFHGNGWFSGSPSLDGFGVSYWDGVSWQWANMGGARATYGIDALTYRDGAAIQHIYVFFDHDIISSPYPAGREKNLSVAFWNGTTWNFADMGVPAGYTQVRNPNGLTFKDSNGTQHIYLFATSRVGPDRPVSAAYYIDEGVNNLVVNHWNGSSWKWKDLGKP